MTDATTTKHVLIGGCGRVGAGLARTLDEAGHDVAVIDRDDRAFRRLGEAFGGRTVRGIVFDRTTLVRAGVEEADAFIAVTSGDNSNIVSARTARDHFGVRNVVARIYDPQRAEIYERHGVTTIATARWTTDAILVHLMQRSGRVETTIGPGEGDVVVIAHDLPPAPAGPWEVESFSRQGRWMLVAVTRTGQTTVPVPRQLVQASERIHLAVQRSALREAEEFITSLDEGEGS
ncbi:TrkA family potassium uptake protein [Euzebya sp.]|uniref:potassium channel family protein n=1 Tax=Euzebya sp. TaxID=1971409 RepID=UPI003512401C